MDLTLDTHSTEYDIPDILYVRCIQTSRRNNDNEIK